MKDRAYEIALHLKYNGYQGGLASMVYKFFDKKIESVKTSQVTANVNEVLAQKLHKPMIKKFKRRKVYARFKDNIWAANLVEMGSLSSKNRGVKYLSCVIDVFSKYLWVKPLTDKKAKTVLHSFIETVNESKRKPKNYGSIKEKNFTIDLCKKK